VTSSTTPNQALAWTELAQLASRTDGTTLRQQFSEDTDRSGRLSGSVGDLWVDWSRNLIDDAILNSLTALADQRNVPDFCARMLSGEVVNTSERLAANHTALRSPGGHTELNRLTAIAERVRDGSLLGSSGKPINAIVSLGIGGSHLGPAMAFDALRHSCHQEITVRFSSGLDGTEIMSALGGLDAAATLFIICSKSLTTAETLTTFETAKDWLKSNGINNLVCHFAAATSNPERAIAIGIDPELIFIIPATVGGRFSLPTATSLALMIAIGPEAFTSLLAGMHEIDCHLAETPIEKNVPMILGLLDVWHRSFLNMTSRVVVPYSYGLRNFPAYLQQLTMESLGKSVTSEGRPVEGPTGPVIWGAQGTDSQHSFFQLLHQGTDIIPVDFIAIARSEVDPRGAHHDQLIANLIGQADALAFGRTKEEAEALNVPTEIAEYLITMGNRPSTITLLPELSAGALGQLVALYEHRTIVQAATWGINPFDQWGVEIGKHLAAEMQKALAAKTGAQNSSVFFDHYLELQKSN